MGQTEVSEDVSGGEAVPVVPPEDLPPTPEEVATPEILNAIIAGYNPDCELIDFKSKLGTAVGDNYMSIMYAITLNLRNKKSGSEESVDIMLKTMPRNAIRQQMINDCGAFIKDAKMYNEIFPEMIKFQKSKGLDESEMYQSWPKCYATYHDGTTDYLAMEDLRGSGYKMANRHSGLDLGHTATVLKNLAKFHAVSFAMFNGDFDTIMEKYPFLEEKMFLPPEKVMEPTKLFFQGSIDHVVKTIEPLGYTEVAETLRSAFGDDFFWTLNKLTGQKVKNAVINHGDAWTNNFMFLYDESGTPKDLKFIDFQLSRCCSRAIDLNYFFFTSPQHHSVLTDKEDEVLMIYHKEFNSFAKKLGVNVDDEGLSWESFKDEFNECRYYGVFTGFMLAPIIAAQSDQVPDMDSLTEQDMTAEGGKEFFNQLISDKANDKLAWIAKNHVTKCSQLAK